MESNFLDQFPLPVPEASADIRSRNLNEQQLDTGVSLMTSGHDKGLSFRFFVHQERNVIKSELTNYPHFDSMDMIEWYKDSRNKITERCHFLPRELLAFDPVDGTCIGGIYKQAYDRFKAGLETPGLSLRRWNVLPEGEVRGLEELGIYTVEQFAAQPRGRIESRFPREIQQAFQQAVEYVNGKDSREQTEKQAEQLMHIMQENSKLSETVSTLQQQLQALISSNAPEPKKGKKAKKDE